MSVRLCGILKRNGWRATQRRLASDGKVTKERTPQDGDPGDDDDDALVEDDLWSGKAKEPEPKSEAFDTNLNQNKMNSSKLDLEKNAGSSSIDNRLCAPSVIAPIFQCVMCFLLQNVWCGLVQNVCSVLCCSWTRLQGIH